VFNVSVFFKISVIHLLLLIFIAAGCGGSVAIGNSPNGGTSGNNAPPVPPPSTVPRGPGNKNLVPPYDVTLAWDPNTDPVLGYNIYYQFESDTPVAIDVGSQTFVRMTFLKSGKYTFYVTAYNDAALESGPSTSVSTSFPWPNGILPETKNQAQQLIRFSN
jgi:hypothetical protein